MHPAKAGRVCKLLQVVWKVVDDCFRGHFSDNDEYVPQVDPKHHTLNIVDKKSGAMLWVFAACSSGCTKRFSMASEEVPVGLS